MAFSVNKWWKRIIYTILCARIDHDLSKNGGPVHFQCLLEMLFLFWCYILCFSSPKHFCRVKLRKLLVSQNVLFLGYITMYEWRQCNRVRQTQESHSYRNFLFMQYNATTLLLVNVQCEIEIESKKNTFTVWIASNSRMLLTSIRKSFCAEFCNWNSEAQFSLYDWELNATFVDG